MYDIPYTMHEKYVFYFPPLPPRNILKVPFEGFTGLLASRF
jgi:hypothetical protein